MDPTETDFTGMTPEEQEQAQRNQQYFQEMLDRQQEEATPPPTVEEPVVQEQQQDPEGKVAGQGGDVRDVAGAIGNAMDNNPITDFMTNARNSIVDALDPNRDREQVDADYQQWTDDAAAAEEARIEEARQTPLGVISDTVVRGVPGALLGATESTLEAAEIIGDTAKTLASKVNMVGYDPKDDPFSDEYNWASWNLGKDELGAQTNAGKIAQGFLEFARIFNLSGGGKAVAGLFKGGKGAKGVLGAMGREGLEGVKADMIMSASGEGNLSNLIKQYAPEWYPDWLSALAIDEDDNPWEAAIKTAFEGGLLGMPIGAIGGFLKGARAADSATKGGADAATAGNKAIEAAQGAVKEAPLDDSATKFGIEYFSAAGDQAAVDMLSKVQEMNKQGIPHTWDDVAMAVPEMFTPGSRMIEAPEFSPEALRKIFDLDPTDPDAGITVNPFTGEVPKSGTMVAIDGAVLENLDDPDAIAGFISRYYDIFTREDAFLGSWVSKKTGKPVVEISRLVPNDPVLFHATSKDAAAAIAQGGFKGGSEGTNILGSGVYTAGDARYAEAYGEELLKIDAKDLSIRDMDMPMQQFMDENGIQYKYYDLSTGKDVDINNPGDLTYEDIGLDIDPASKKKLRELLSEGGKYDAIKYDPIFQTNTRGIADETLIFDPSKAKQRVGDVGSDKAFALGRIFDQEGIYRLDDGTYTKTGGADQLRKTKGENLRGISSRPAKSTPVSKQEAAVSVAKADNTLGADGLPARRMLTDNQVARLADEMDTEEVLREINDASEINLSELASEAKLSEGEVVQNAVQKLGDDFGFYPGDINKLDRNAEGYLTREGIVQARMVMKELSSRVAIGVKNYTMKDSMGADGMAALEQTVTSLKAFMREYKVTMNLTSKRLSAGAIELPKEFGIKGNKIDNFIQPNGQTIDEAFKRSEETLDKMLDGMKSSDPRARKTAGQIAAQLSLMGDNPQQLGIAAMSLSEIGMKYGLKVMYNSMLSSAATHIVNATSNFTAMVLRPTAALVGGDIRAKKAAIASFYSFGETISDALKMAAKEWNLNAANAKGIDNSTGMAALQLEDLAQRAAESGDAKFQAGVRVMQLVQGIADMPGMGLPSRMLTTSDAFFKSAVQRMEYKRMMMEEAIDIGGSDTKAIFKDLVQKNLDLNFTKSGEVMNAELERLAKEVTFQQDLEGTAKKFGEWVDSYPGLKIFFPFVRTGHNVATYTASYVPFIGTKISGNAARLADPAVSSYEKAIIKGREKLGGLFVVSAGMMAANGMLTGNGPMEAKARKRWLEENQPRSIKIGDTFISLDRVEPFGPLLAAVADINYAFNNGLMNEDRAQWLSGYLIQTMALNVTDRTFFQGFQKLSNFLDPSGGNAGMRMVTTGADAFNNLIPFAGARRMLTNMINPYMNEFNEQYDRVLHNATLGMLGNKATAYDFITGEPVDNMSGGINALLPIKINQKEQNDVKQALMNIEYNSDKIIEELGRTGVNLTPEQKQFMQKKMGEGGLEKSLRNIISREDWRAAVKEYRDNPNKTGVPLQNQLFYRLIDQEVSRYADWAMEQLKLEYPELQQAITSYKNNANADKYGGLVDYAN